jgi:hypothetical protein
MCGSGSKICPPERATELLEAIIEPGDRVVIEDDNRFPGSSAPDNGRAEHDALAQ